jgi:hypothetical protein
MAYSRTLAELELAVRREADMVNSQFVTSAEVQSYINQSWAELYDRIVLFDQEYLLRYTDIPSTSGSSAGDFDILNDGLTGLVRSVSWFVPSGVGYAVGDVVALTQPSTGANTAWIQVTNVVGGAVNEATVIAAGNGYKTDTLTVNTAALNMSPISGGGFGGVAIGYVESDFYKCKGVWAADAAVAATPTWNPLRRFQWDEQNALRQINTYQGFAALPLYRVYTVSGREKVGLAPMMTGTYRIWYYPAPQRMLIPTDRIDGRAGWDEWVVKDSAIKCLLKEESIEQAAAIKAVRDELFSRFQLHASERDASQPEKIRNVNLLSRRPFPWAR